MPEKPKTPPYAAAADMYATALRPEFTEAIGALRLVRERIGAADAAAADAYDRALAMMRKEGATMGAAGAHVGLGAVDERRAAARDALLPAVDRLLAVLMTDDEKAEAYRAGVAEAIAKQDRARAAQPAKTTYAVRGPDAAPWSGVTEEQAIARARAWPGSRIYATGPAGTNYEQRILNGRLVDA